MTNRHTSCTAEPGFGRTYLYGFGMATLCFGEVSYPRVVCLYARTWVRPYKWYDKTTYLLYIRILVLSCNSKRLTIVRTQVRPYKGYLDLPKVSVGHLRQPLNLKLSFWQLWSSYRGTTHSISAHGVHLSHMYAMGAALQQTWVQQSLYKIWWQHIWPQQNDLHSALAMQFLQKKWWQHIWPQQNDLRSALAMQFLQKKWWQHIWPQQNDLHSALAMQFLQKKWWQHFWR